MYGLWQVQEQVPVDDDRGKTGNDTYVFDYEGDTVTLRLMTLHPGQWKSSDDFYRLAAKREGDTLYYRPPFGDEWVELATVEDGRFVDLGSGRKRIFRNIDASEVADWNRAILAEREPHDYRIQPDGSLAQE